MTSEQFAWSASTVSGARNATTDALGDDDLTGWRRIVQIAYEVMLVTTLAVVMLAMGSSIRPIMVWQQIRRPFGVCVGFASQFFLFPAAMFGFSRALSLSLAQEIGVMVLACCPGGGLSNMLTYFVNGHVPLSVCMTAVSTTASFLMMPFNLWLYSHSWQGSATPRIPFLQIFLSLLFILVPLSIGMLILWFNEKAAKVVTKVGSLAGFAIIVFLIVSQSVARPATYTAQPWQVWFLACVGSPVGFLIGFTLSRALRQPSSYCRTVGLETGVQNVTLVLGILKLSFEDSFLGEAEVIPTLYGFFMAMFGFGLSGIAICRDKRAAARRNSHDAESEDGNGTSASTLERHSQRAHGEEGTRTSKAKSKDHELENVSGDGEANDNGGVAAARADGHDVPPISYISRM